MADKVLMISDSEAVGALAALGILSLVEQPELTESSVQTISEIESIFCEIDIALQRLERRRDEILNLRQETTQLLDELDLEFSMIEHKQQLAPFTMLERRLKDIAEVVEGICGTSY